MGQEREGDFGVTVLHLLGLGHTQVSAFGKVIVCKFYHKRNKKDLAGILNSS